jgi:hypothetical protein
MMLLQRCYRFKRLIQPGSLPVLGKFSAVLVKPFEDKAQSAGREAALNDSIGD